MFCGVQKAGKIWECTQVICGDTFNSESHDITDTKICILYVFKKLKNAYFGILQISN